MCTKNAWQIESAGIEEKSRRNRAKQRKYRQSLSPTRIHKEKDRQYVEEKRKKFPLVDLDEKSKNVIRDEWAKTKRECGNKHNLKSCVKIEDPQTRKIIGRKNQSKIIFYILNSACE